MLDAGETEKEEGKIKGPTKKVTPKKWGGLENGQKVVPPFLSKKIGFFKILKNPNFYSVSRKNGWQPFFSKRLCYKEDRLRGNKTNDNFLVPFRQKCLRRCQSKKKGGLGGGRSPPQKGREKHNHGRVLVVFVVVGCCFCFLLLLLLLLYLCFFC